MQKYQPGSGTWGKSSQGKGWQDKHLWHVTESLWIFYSLSIECVSTTHSATLDMRNQRQNAWKEPLKALAPCKPLCLSGVYPCSLWEKGYWVPISRQNIATELNSQETQVGFPSTLASCLHSPQQLENRVGGQTAFPSQISAPSEWMVPCNELFTGGSSKKVKEFSSALLQNPNSPWEKC